MLAFAGSSTAKATEKPKVTQIVMTNQLEMSFLIIRERMILSTPTDSQYEHELISRRKLQIAPSAYAILQ